MYAIGTLALIANALMMFIPVPMLLIGFFYVLETISPLELFEGTKLIEVLHNPSGVLIRSLTYFGAIWGY